jgi:hypothetical protein
MFAATRTHEVRASRAASRADWLQVSTLPSAPGSRTGHRNKTPWRLMAVNSARGEKVDSVASSGQRVRSLGYLGERAARWLAEGGRNRDARLGEIRPSILAGLSGETAKPGGDGARPRRRTSGGARREDLRLLGLTGAGDAGGGAGGLPPAGQGASPGHRRRGSFILLKRSCFNRDLIDAPRLTA